MSSLYFFQAYIKYKEKEVVSKYIKIVEGGTNTSRINWDKLLGQSDR